MHMSSCAYGVYAYRTIIALYAYTPYAYKCDRVLGVLGNLVVKPN